VIINLKGTALVASNVFGVDPNVAALVALVVVLVYSTLGGLWASVSTSTLATLLHTVPPAVIIVAALHGRRRDVHLALGGRPGDAAAVGPYLISHLGLPTWIVFAP
jgi:Na+/proline symporter